MRPIHFTIALAWLLIGGPLLIAQQNFQSSWDQPWSYTNWRQISHRTQDAHNGAPANEWTPESEREESEPQEAEIDEPEFESPYDEPMETDRHDFTQAPKVVGAGVLQLEYGFLYSTLEEGTKRETTYATPELLVRYGVNERTEFRLRYNYGWKFDNEEEDIQGSEDIRFGIKYQLAEQECRRPDMAVELLVTAPTGSADLSTGRWEPGVDFLYGWELANGWTLAGSFGFISNGFGDITFTTVETDFEDQFVVWTQSLAVGKRLTEKNTAYFEWFGLFSHGREDDNGLSFLNVGVDHYFTKNLLIDVRVGWGLTSASDDIFAGIGGAVRF